MEGYRDFVIEKLKTKLYRAEAEQLLELALLVMKTKKLENKGNHGAILEVMRRGNQGIQEQRKHNADGGSRNREVRPIPVLVGKNYIQTIAVDVL